MEEAKALEEANHNSEKNSTSLSIAPYPLENGATEKDENLVAIPADSNKDLGELTPEDVNIADTAQEIADKEKIFWNETETFNIIEGFGSDMPLALALRQIVPAQYAFSFGKGVNPGTTISWTGGQPWNIVLDTAISPLGITFQLDDKKILLRAAETSNVISDPVNDNSSIEGKTEIIEDEANTVTISEETVEDTIEDVIEQEEKQVTAEELDVVEEKVVIEIIEEDIDLDMVEIDDNDEGSIILKGTNADHAQSAYISTPAQKLETRSLQEVINTVTDEQENSNDNSNQIIEKPLEDKPTIIDKTSIQRNSIQDPGETESVQPEHPIKSEAETLLDEKKNELDNALQNNVPVKSSAFINQPSDEIITWEAGSGSNLQEVLKIWSQKENVRFNWNASKSYVLDKNIFISGTFKNALDIILSTGIKNPPTHIITQSPSYSLLIEDHK